MEATVRLAGRITDWNDDKGFGFVVPSGGGERAFVHVNAFQRGSRRPVPGDLISYLPGKDARGRLQASEIRHAGQRIEVSRQPSRLPRATIGIAALIAAAVAARIGWIPALLAGAYVALSAVSYLMYWFDKSAAGRGARRTPESNLHLADLLGGWPGALIAQQQFRHKTIKQSFQSVFWLTVVVNLVAAGWLVSSGLAAELAQSLGG
ncbi:DUF1294 domain-containing protein [Lysobacter sp. F6437]|uniref:DUF1294 domain-containing protein n=1 Tax=Lysobacter sp. F6437 TaxID=3459296 RepID=UPI00403E1284